LFGVSSIKNS